MSTTAQVVPVSKKSSWIGRVLSILIVLFLLFDAAGKLMKPAQVVDAFGKLGWPLSQAVPMGIVLLVCAIIYAIPRISVLGAILLTGYLGGAVSTQWRVGNPVFETIFPIIFGVLVWVALYLREPRLRALVPLKHQGGRQ